MPSDLREVASYLANCSQISRGNFVLARLDRASHLEHSLRELMRELMQALAAAELAEYLHKHGEEIIATDRALARAPRSVDREQPPRSTLRDHHHLSDDPRIGNGPEYHLLMRINRFTQNPVDPESKDEAKRYGWTPSIKYGDERPHLNLSANKLSAAHEKRIVDSLKSRRIVAARGVRSHDGQELRIRNEAQQEWLKVSAPKIVKPKPDRPRKRAAVHFRDGVHSLKIGDKEFAVAPGDVITVRPGGEDDGRIDMSDASEIGIAHSADLRYEANSSAEPHSASLLYEPPETAAPHSADLLHEGAQAAKAHSADLRYEANSTAEPHSASLLYEPPETAAPHSADLLYAPKATVVDAVMVRRVIPVHEGKVWVIHPRGENPYTPRERKEMVRKHGGVPRAEDLVEYLTQKQYQAWTEFRPDWKGWPTPAPKAALKTKPLQSVLKSGPTGLWDRMKRQIETADRISLLYVNPHTFQTWIFPTREAGIKADGTLVIRVPSSVFHKQLREKLKDQISRAFAAVTGEKTLLVEYAIDDEIDILALGAPVEHAKAKEAHAR